MLFEVLDTILLKGEDFKSFEVVKGLRFTKSGVRKVEIAKGACYSCQRIIIEGEVCLDILGTQIELLQISTIC
jgi:hypothetical protein